jgi:hypothetical protein
MVCTVAFTAPNGVGDEQIASGRHALGVDDEMLVFTMIEDMLADLGCE